MTIDELQAIERAYTESKIQHTCVWWFRKTFPEYARLLFSVPNGGYRAHKTAVMMVYEGQVSGVSDLILLIPSGEYHGLCIEMKVPKKKGSSAGRQSESQQQWQSLVEKNGYRYAVCHGLAEFIGIVCEYLGLSLEEQLNNALKHYALYR